jgi:N-acetylmuramoyl-L-alanine amidase
VNAPAPPPPPPPPLPAITNVPHSEMLFAEITGADTWAFPDRTTTGGSHWMLPPGAQDRVTGTAGTWTRLASGGWVQNENIRTWRDPAHTPADGHGFISEGRYIAGTLEDVIVWDAPFSPATWAAFDGNTLTLRIAKDSIAPPIFHNGTIFEQISRENNTYTMTLRDGARLEGFYTSFTDGQLRLHLRHRRPLTQGNYPFDGFTFHIDAGHGGHDPGALGAMGADMPEAHIVLTQAQQLRAHLEMLGATVILSREADYFLTLQERVNLNLATIPDMFISLHTDSTAESTDATNIRGFTVWYRNYNALPAARLFLEQLHYVNPHTTRNRDVRHANFFVTRPVHAPSVLFEASFTNNIHDFSWLINPRHKLDYTWGIVNALLRYYS